MSGNTKHGKVYHYEYFCEQNDYMDEEAFKLYEMKYVDSVKWLVYQVLLLKLCFLKISNYKTESLGFCKVGTKYKSYLQSCLLSNYKVQLRYRVIILSVQCCLSFPATIPICCESRSICFS